MAAEELRILVMLSAFVLMLIAIAVFCLWLTRRQDEIDTFLRELDELDDRRDGRRRL